MNFRQLINEKKDRFSSSIRSAFGYIILRINIPKSERSINKIVKKKEKRAKVISKGPERELFYGNQKSYSYKEPETRTVNVISAIYLENNVELPYKLSCTKKRYLDAIGNYCIDHIDEFDEGPVHVDLDYLLTSVLGTVKRVDETARRRLYSDLLSMTMVRIVREIKSFEDTDGRYRTIENSPLLDATFLVDKDSNGKLLKVTMVLEDVPTLFSWAYDAGRIISVHHEIWRYIAGENNDYFSAANDFILSMISWMKHDRSQEIKRLRYEIDRIENQKKGRARSKPVKLKDSVIRLSTVMEKANFDFEAQNYNQRNKFLESIKRFFTVLNDWSYIEGIEIHRKNQKMDSFELEVLLDEDNEIQKLREQLQSLGAGS